MKLKNLSNNIDPFGIRVNREILKTEATKKFIENQIRHILTGEKVKVLKQNPGHITLCEVETMPPPELIKAISKYCSEKIIFKLKDENEAAFKYWNEWERKKLKKIKNNEKRKAKRKRKRILKAIYRGFAPNPTSF